MNTTNVAVEDGKYTVQIGDDGSLKALRYGEPWRDLTGDKLIYCLAAELQAAREQLEAVGAGGVSTLAPVRTPDELQHLPQAALLVRDVAEMAGVSVPELCAAVRAIGYGQMSTNMAIHPMVAVTAIARLRKTGAFETLAQEAVA